MQEIDIQKLIIWIVFCFSSGFVEAIFFSGRDYGREFYMDPHIPLSFLRTFVLIGICLPVEIGFLRLFLSFALMFPFLHDGMYYVTRGKIIKDVPGYNWFSYSDQSTAFIEIGPAFRILFFIFGLAIFVLNK